MISEAGATSKQSVSRLSKALNICGVALLWGACCAALVGYSLIVQERFESFHFSTLLSLFALGGVLAWAFSTVFVKLARRYVKRGWLIYLLALIVLALTTLTFTSGLFALQYRSFYAQWHEQAFSRIWVLQFLFTSASAVYQFLVIGLRHYFPLGLPLLLGSTAILVRSVR